jgi:AAA-like domain
VDSFYVAGGTLSPKSAAYISRPADYHLFELCQNGTLAYVLATRQTGKSSLMARTAWRLGNEGYRVVLVDLTVLGVSLTAEQWYLGMLYSIADQLELEDFDSWSELHSRFSTAQRIRLFFEDFVLKKLAGRVVVFIDEIDIVLGLPFSADDFWASIRSLYNARASTPELERLSFVLLGVAVPGDLVSNEAITPFNIGVGVELTDFTFEEARPLLAGLDLDEEEAEVLLNRVLSWTGGHPYLTQRVFGALASEPKPFVSVEKMGELITALFFGEAGRSDSNLAFVRRMLTERDQRGEALKLYQRIRSGKRVPDNERDRACIHLKLSGLVIRADGVLKVRNRIYESFFDLQWVYQHELGQDLYRYSQGLRRPTKIAIVIAACMVIALLAFVWAVTR